MIHAAEGRGSIFGRETKIPQAARRDQKTKTKNNSSEKKPKKNKKELRLILAISITKMEITDTKLLCFSFPVFFLSIMTALLRYNSHTIEFTHVTCIIQCFLVYLQSCATITSNFRTFSSPPKETLYLLAVIPHSLSTLPHPPQGKHPSIFCLMDLPVLDISYKWNHSTCGLL